MNKTSFFLTLALLSLTSALHAVDQHNETRKRQGLLYPATAHRQKISHFIQINESDSIRFYHNLITGKLGQLENRRRKNQKEKEQIDEIKRSMSVAQAVLYFNENQYNLALIELNKLLLNPTVERSILFQSNVYSLIATAHLYNRHAEKALENFKRAYDLSNQLPDSLKLGQYAFFAPLEGIGMAYGELEKYNDAERMTDTLRLKIEAEYQRYNTATEPDNAARFRYRYFKNRAICCSALWHTKMQQPLKAREHLDRVKPFTEALFNDTILQYNFDLYYLVEAEYYLMTGDLPAAKAQVQILTDKLTVEEDAYCYFKSHSVLATILYAEGNNRQAYELLSKLYRLNDSLHSVNYSQKALKLYTQSEVEKALKSSGENQVRLRNTVATLLIALLVILLIVSIITYLTCRNQTRLITKNRQLIEEYREIEHRQKKISELEIIRQSLTAPLNGDDEGSSDHYGQLIERLDHYLQESGVYRNSEISREELALKMGTNRQYLIEAIKQKTGKTFNEYIYAYRLKFAYEQIVNNKNKSISAILHESGFLTRATFYRAFKEVYSVTPGELRDYRETD